MKKMLLGLWLPALILLSWEIAVSTGMLNRLIFPPPSAIVQAARDMALRGELQQHLSATLTRLFLGFFIGSFTGLGCGVLMGTVRAVRYSLEPIISGAYATPKLSLLPLLMLFMGVGESARIALIAVGSFVLMAMHGLDAVRQVPPRFVELAANYGATGSMILRKVFLPASLRQPFTVLRLALGRSLTITIALELVSCPDGLGSMIWIAWQTFYTEKFLSEFFYPHCSAPYCIFHSNDWRQGLFPGRVGFTKATLLGALLFFLFAYVLFAAQTTGILEGWVFDPSGRVIAGVELTLTDIDRGTSRTLATDSGGRYQARNLAPGVYQIEVRCPVFDKQYAGRWICPQAARFKSTFT